MKVTVGGVGWSEWYQIDSNNKYANEIVEGVHEGYRRICGLSIPRLIKDMSTSQINKYLLFLFQDCEKNFSIEEAKSSLKDELLRIMKNCETEEELKTRNKLINSRMKEFNNDDIVDFIAKVVACKIRSANDKYQERIDNLIQESLYS